MIDFVGKSAYAILDSLIAIYHTSIESMFKNIWHRQFRNNSA
ncbi:hypothetical protein NTE_02248 [Candidatus Nitrososphaera evergladensis SR1]|uniref:Uncharacterized protein n=1 Tax=Candidatus Nitrososphaera evergladensis SR1 TaxID=1459636 RepID=A0A075MUB0_9ARCH|nr:hypothetical protein NTE_02248 [Candidatus Nitrososphaera evergladensis SR1]